MTAPSRPGLLAITAAAIALVLGGVGAILYGRHRTEPIAAEPVALRAGVFEPARSAPDFKLRGSDGAEITLERYRGKVVLVTFGFTYCAAVCPTTMATLAQARESLGDDAQSIQVIFITVDPGRDDVAHLRNYLSSFGDGVVGATGSEEALAQVRERYGVTAVRQGDGLDYAIAHTSSIFLVDRAGKLRAMMPFGHDAADFVHDVRRLLEA